MTWLLVDADRDDKRVRGPFKTGEAAGAVRRELERSGYYAENGNLCIVPEEEED